MRSTRTVLVALCLLITIPMLAPWARAAASDLSDAVVDWNHEDWRLDRAMLVRVFLYQSVATSDAWADYQLAVHTPAGIDSLTADQFRGAPAPLRLDRSRKAWQEVRKGILAVYDPASQLVQAAQENEQPCLAGSCPPPASMGVGVTRALAHFTRAVALDPTNVVAWYHLGYFLGLVGDTERAHLARMTFLAQLADLPGDEQKTLVTLRTRAVLDEAWGLREAGRFDDCEAWLTEHMPYSAKKVEGVAPVHEARLLQALCAAEQGRWIEARELGNNLPMLEVPVRSFVAWQLPATSAGPGLSSYSPEAYDNITDANVDIMRLNFNKLAWERRENDMLRRWVQVWSAFAAGREDEARRLIGEPTWDLEYPPGLGARWWQDQGTILEALGEHDLAQRCYGRAAVYHPYFIYFPLESVRGIPEVHGVRDTGADYMLAYRTFFVAGSIFSYAANAALACEAELPGPARDLVFNIALSGLDACRRRHIHPTDALALRGRLRFLQENYTAAQSDLETAHAELSEAGREDGQVQLMLGLVHFNDHDFTGAIPWLRRFTELSPDAAIGWRTLGLAFAYSGQDTEALAAIDKAVVLEPDAPSGLYNRGLLHYRAGERDLATADFARAHDLLPDNPQITQMLEAARSGPLQKLELTPSPVRLEMSAQERAAVARARQASKVGVAAAATDLGALAPDERQPVLQRLQAEYAKEPSPARRDELAWTALTADRADVTQRLLSPLWPDKLTRDELMLLLQADRRRGEAKRASALVATLPRGTERWTDPSIWSLAAAIALDIDNRDLARQALEAALRLAPDNMTLKAQLDRLKN